MLRFWLPLLAVTFCGLAAHAQPASAPATELQEAVPETVPAAVTEYTFGNEEVDGTFKNPDVVVTPGHVGGRFPSLVKIRQSFLPEMVASVDTL